jgi:hypothetical protein
MPKNDAHNMAVRTSLDVAPGRPPIVGAAILGFAFAARAPKGKRGNGAQKLKQNKKR